METKLIVNTSFEGLNVTRLGKEKGSREEILVSRNHNDKRNLFEFIIEFDYIKIKSLSILRLDPPRSFLALGFKSRRSEYNSSVKKYPKHSRLFFLIKSNSTIYYQYNFFFFY